MSFKSISPGDHSFHVVFDTNSFKRELIRLTQKVASATEDSMKLAMEQFKYDCLEEIPKCPVEFGTLRASHSIRVDRTVIVGNSYKTTAHDFKGLLASQNGGVIVGTLTVNTAYAASLHEGITPEGKPYHFHSPDTGSHWVISKLLMYGNNYLKIISSGILTPSDSTAYKSILNNFISTHGITDLRK